MSTIFGILLQGIVSAIFSGVIVAFVKSNLANFYAEKSRALEKTDSLREENYKKDKLFIEHTMIGLKNEVIAVKGKLNNQSEKIGVLDTKIQVVINEQQNQSRRIEDVREIVKQNYGKVFVRD